MDNCCLRSAFRRISCCAVQALILVVLLIPSFAVESEEPIGEGEELPANPYYSFEIVDPIPVIIMPGEEEAQVFDALPRAAGDGFPFYGSAWVKGSVSGLGQVSVYFPINRKEFVGVDSSGRIFNVSDNSWSGVMYDSSGTTYTVSFGSFALPRFRVYSGSSWEYETLYLVPSESNLVLPDGPSSAYSLSDLLPWVSLLLVGGVLLCCMRKS